METMTHHNQELGNVEYWSEALRPTFAGKKVIVAGDVIAGLIPRARMIRELGAESTFMLATEGMGTGDAPTEEDGHWFALDASPNENIVEAIHATQRLLGDLPQHAKEALDWYDPDHEDVNLWRIGSLSGWHLTIKQSSILFGIKLASNVNHPKLWLSKEVKYSQRVSDWIKVMV
jgi:hypothetical protein